jgi:hypothetical protein
MEGVSNRALPLLLTLLLPPYYQAYDASSVLILHRRRVRPARVNRKIGDCSHSVIRDLRRPPTHPLV